MGLGGDGTCNQWGCAVNWGNFPIIHSSAGGPPQNAPQLYGVHAARNGINTASPFGVSVSVNRLGGLQVVLTQGGRTVPFFNESSASNPVGADCGGGGCGIRDPPTSQPKGLPQEAMDVSASAWQHGMTLIVSLWGDNDPKGMAKWLDHECPASQRGGVDRAIARFKNLHIEESHIAPSPPQPFPPPPPSSSTTAAATAATALPAAATAAAAATTTAEPKAAATTAVAAAAAAAAAATAAARHLYADRRRRRLDRPLALRL